MSWPWIVLGCIGGVLLLLLLLFCFLANKKKKYHTQGFDDVGQGKLPTRQLGLLCGKPKGLPNIGATCYMNAMVQCLAWSPCLALRLKTDKQKSPWRGNSIAQSLSNVLETYYDDDNDDDDDDGCCRRGYTDQRQRLRNEMDSFFNMFSNKNGRFNNKNKQEDTFEFFNALISTLQDEALENAQVRVESDTFDEHIMQHCGISRLYYGKFITCYYYEECRHVDVVFQAFTSLSIPAIKSLSGSRVPRGSRKAEEMTDVNEWSSGREGNVNTIHVKASLLLKDKIRNMSLAKKQRRRGIEETGVEKGLGYLTEPETMVASEINCRICAKEGKEGTTGLVYKTLQMISLPPVLVLHINRFEQHGTELHKMDEHVTFPKLLDMASFCSITMRQVSAAGGKLTPGEFYSLFAVINHHGTAKRGHYYSFIKTSHRNACVIQKQQLWNQWHDPERVASGIRAELETRLQDEQSDTEANERHLEKDEFPEVRQTDEGEPETWFDISDMNVSKIGEDVVMKSKHAYILMYERM